MNKNWNKQVFLECSIDILIRFGFSVVEFIYVYGGRWSRCTSYHLHMNTPCLCPPWSQRPANVRALCTHPVVALRFSAVLRVCCSTLESLCFTLACWLEHSASRRANRVCRFSRVFSAIISLHLNLRQYRWSPVYGLYNADNFFYDALPYLMETLF